jgi:hypothetical protein
MTLEWLRRRDEALDRHLRTYQFSQGDILATEEAAEHGGSEGPPADDGSLGLGSLKVATS